MWFKSFARRTSVGLSPVSYTFAGVILFVVVVVVVAVVVVCCCCKSCGSRPSREGPQSGCPK